MLVAGGSLPVIPTKPGLARRVPSDSDIEGAVNAKPIPTMLVASLLVMGTAAQTSAQVTPDTVDSTPKGTIGLGLVGAELGLIVPAAFGADEVWALTIFPVLGAAGGAVAGYFTLDEPGREKGSVAALVTGMAGVIPALLLTVKALRYDPDDEKIPEVDPYAARRRDIARAGSGLLKRSQHGLHVAVPGFTIEGPSIPRKLDSTKLGTSPVTNVHVSVFSGVF